MKLYFTDLKKSCSLPKFEANKKNFVLKVFLHSDI